MNYGWSQLLQSCLATLVLPCFFLAPGYVICSATNLFLFRYRTWVERVLWAVAFSVPVVLMLTTHCGITLSPIATMRMIEAVALIALALFVRDSRSRIKQSFIWDHYATVGALAAFALVIYCLLASSPIQIKQRLYEPAAWQDWGVRIQLINAAIRNNMHPANPMFAVRGIAPPLHYYYFWYVLCAQISLMAGVGARAALTASCVGAAMAFVSCLFVCLKHLGISQKHVRQQCLASLLTACVLGLDIIPATLRLILPYKRVYSDIQLWLNDRSPSWLHLLLWAPHHVAGLVCCILGLLLVVTAHKQSWRRVALSTALAALCFAAAVGTSTFVVAFFVIVCLAVLLDAAKRREWKVVFATCVSGVLALLLALPFLMASVVGNSGPKAATKNSPNVLKFDLRYRDQAHDDLQRIFHFKESIQRHTEGYRMPPASLLQKICAPFLMLLFFVADFGFFLFVLAYRARRDFFSPRPLDRNLRIHWLIFFGVAIPGVLLSSAPLQGNNDLGRHAGMCMRFVFLLWSAPLVASYLAGLRRPKAVTRKATRTRIQAALRHCAVVAFVLGLLAQVWQIGISRFDMQLVEAGKIPAFAVATRVPNIGWRFNQLRLAMDYATKVTTNDAIVQSNPHGRMQPVYLLYATRQMVASDDGCNTPFGGNVLDCAPISKALIELFGGTKPDFQGESYEIKGGVPMDPAKLTPQNFNQVCHDDKLSLIIATYSDPVWHHLDSWVWQLQPVFANSTSRVFACSAP
jgi:hypothetical protein